MLRRHILQNTELETLARKIWAQHREALEVLSAYAPNLNGELLTTLSEQHLTIAEKFSHVTGMTIIPEESSRTILRFAVEEWDKFPLLLSGDGSWMTTKRVLIIELMQWGKNKFRISLVIGPGDPEVRESIYQAVLSDEKLKVGRRTNTANTNWKHLSSLVVLKEKTIKDAENAGESVEKLLNALIKNSSGFLKRDLARYDQILNDIFFD